MGCDLNGEFLDIIPPSEICTQRVPSHFDIGHVMFPSIILVNS
jgi:hypothetical protein